MVIGSNKWELDVQAYLNACNITSPTARKPIFDFASGINSLGLWDSIICWPLRSGQNIGTGSTVFSLGGLRSQFSGPPFNTRLFNGVLQNGPAWGSNGIVFDGVDDNIGIVISPFTTINFPFTLVSVYYPTKQGQFQGLFTVRSRNAGLSPTMLLSIDSPPKLWASSIGPTVDGYLETGGHINVWKFGACRFSNGSSQVTVDGTQFPESSMAATSMSGTANAGIGNNAALEYFGGTVAFCMYVAATGVEQPIRSLYKETLAAGIALP